MGHKALAAAGPGWPYETWTPGAPCQGRLLENRVVLSKGNVLSVYSPMTGGQADTLQVILSTQYLKINNGWLIDGVNFL